MMSEAGSEYYVTAEIHDVASGQIVGAPQMLPKLIVSKVANGGDFSAGISSRDLGKLVQRQANDA
jgi:hypothetical protein